MRDYFRRDLLGQKGGRSAIDILISRPDDLGIQGASNLEPLLLACEALLMSNDVAAAIELYVSRFEKGRAFLASGLPKEGKRLYDAFEHFATSAPAYLKNAQLYTNFDAIYFRNGAILFDILLGELNDADQLLAVQLQKTTDSRRSIAYNHKAHLAFCRGEFSSAAELSNSAIAATMQAKATGTRALIHAQAHFTRVKALVAMGLIREAAAAYTLLFNLRDRLDSEDGQILWQLAQMALLRRIQGWLWHRC